MSECHRPCRNVLQLRTRIDKVARGLCLLRLLLLGRPVNRLSRTLTPAEAAEFRDLMEKHYAR